MTVEDGVFIGPGAILTNDRYPRADHVDRATSPGPTTGGQPDPPRATGCSIGAGAVVVAGVDVGRFATVGAGAVVTRDVADHALVVGNPGPPASAGSAPAAQRLVDATGDPAPAEPRPLRRAHAS